MYHEDTDLGWRLRLAGLRVVRATRSRVRHHYDFARTPTKMYHLERNRWTLLLTNYHRSTVLILMPAFVVADLGVWFVAVRDGWARSKIRAMRDLRGRRAERRDERRLVEANRRITDAAMLASMDTGVSEVRQIAPPRGSRVVDAVLSGYLRLALPLVRLAGRRSELATPPV